MSLVRGPGPKAGEWNRSHGFAGLIPVQLSPLSGRGGPRADRLLGAVLVLGEQANCPWPWPGRVTPGVTWGCARECARDQTAVSQSPRPGLGALSFTRSHFSLLHNAIDPYRPMHPGLLPMETQPMCVKFLPLPGTGTQQDQALGLAVTVKLLLVPRCSRAIAYFKHFSFSGNGDGIFLEGREP